MVESCSPNFFERLVVELLVKMGYGGTLQDAGKAVGKSGFGFAISGLTVETFMQEKSLVRMGVEPVKIEVANFISGVEFEEAYQDKVVVVIDEVQIDLISLHYLKINKKASGRYKDLNDLENLP